MGSLKIGRMVLGPMQTNSYFVYREGESSVMYFDPPSSGAHIFDKLKDAGFEPEVILLTHGHFDHIGGAAELREKSGVKIGCMEEEKVLLEDSWINVSAQMRGPITLEADFFFRDGDVLEYGDKKCRVIGTPGHTAGGCCFYFEEAGICICGDTLFAESIGRTDFPTGDEATLFRSVREKIFALPDDTALYPGHGPATTVGHEKKNNPFFA